jgi:uncharacterized protein
MKSRVLITGATGGLGKAFAVEAARRGWDLMLTDINQTSLDSLAAGLERTYDIQVSSFACDLTRSDSREALIDFWTQTSTQFRMLINIAGGDRQGFFLDLERNSIQTIVRLNIEALLVLTHAALKRKDPRHTIRVINVSSLAAFFPMPVKATYAASKRFVLDFSLALGNELRGQGGTVTVLCPAGLPTTVDTIAAIEAQGLAGYFTTRNTGAVAEATIRHALKGNSLYIPGLPNQILKFLGGLIPAPIITALIGRRWRTAEKKSKREIDERKSHGITSVLPSNFADGVLEKNTKLLSKPRFNLWRRPFQKNLT